MARRREFSVEDLPMVGGAWVLDFVNTTGARARGTPRERLHSYGDLLSWATRAGILAESDAAEVRSTARRNPGDAAAVLQRALVIREDAYAVLAPLALGREPMAGPLSRLERWLTRACVRRRVDIRDGKPVLTWTITPSRLDSVLWPIIGSAESVLTTDFDRLRKCGECDWLFLDISRNGRRQWCKKLCGDRVRARRYYEHASQANPERS